MKTKSLSLQITETTHMKHYQLLVKAYSFKTIKALFKPGQPVQK